MYWVEDQRSFKLIIGLFYYFEGPDAVAKPSK